MKNIEELRNNLSSLFDQIKTGQMDVKAAAEMNNTAGKIISTLKVQLDYAARHEYIATTVTQRMNQLCAYAKAGVPWTDFYQPEAVDAEWHTRYQALPL